METTDDMKNSGDDTTKNNSMPKLVQLVNDKLPDDIRVHSIMKTNNGLIARNAASWREYEYLLPLKALITSKKDTTKDEKIFPE